MSGSVMIAVFSMSWGATGTVPLGTRTVTKIEPELPGGHTPAVPVTYGLSGSAVFRVNPPGHTEAGPLALTYSTGTRLPWTSVNLGSGSTKTDPSHPSAVASLLEQEKFTTYWTVSPGPAVVCGVVFSASIGRASPGAALALPGTSTRFVATMSTATRGRTTAPIRAVRFRCDAISGVLSIEMNAVRADCPGSTSAVGREN